MADVGFIKSRFDELFKLCGKQNVNDLKRADRPYSYLNGLTLVGSDGKKLSIQEKFALVGYRRQPKFEKPLERAKRLVEEFVADGKTVDDLTKKDEALRYLEDAKIRGENGDYLTLEEKFAAVGYPRTPKRTKDVVQKMHNMLENFERETGRSVQSLTEDDKEYQYVWGVDIKDENGRSLTLQEKFAIAGFERKQKYSSNVKQDLIDGIEDYLAKGGSFHVQRNSFPFANKLYIYKTGLEKSKGVKLSNNQIMKELGYKQYSDTYYRYRDLEKMAEFVDKDNFADDYKKDKKMRAFVNDAAISLNLPIAVVVELVCGFDLKQVCIETEYFSFVKEEILKFAKKNNNSLEGISKREPLLYSRISLIRKYVSTSYGENISSYDVLRLLDLGHLHNLFSDKPKPVKDISAAISELSSIAQKQNGKIFKKDIENDDYDEIVLKSVRLGMTTKEFFKKYNIDYVDGRSNVRLKKIYAKKYPYIDEMRQRKQELLNERCSSQNLCKEELFEENLNASLQAYRDFKDKIYKSETEKINNFNEKVKEKQF